MMINRDQGAIGKYGKSGIMPPPVPAEHLTGLSVFSVSTSTADKSPTIEASVTADREGALAAFCSYGEVTGFPPGGLPIIAVGKGQERWTAALIRATNAQLAEAWAQIEERERNRATQQTAECQEKEMPVIQWTESGAGLEPGVYRAKVTEIMEETGQFGPQLRFQFKTLDSDGAESDGEIRGWCSAKWGPKAKLFDWARAILRAKCPGQGQPFDSDSLLNRKCDIEVVGYKKADGSDGTKIDRLYPYGTMSSQGDDN